MLKASLIAAALALPVFFGSTDTAQAECRLQKVAGADAPLPLRSVNKSLLNAALLAEVNYARCQNGRAALQSVSGMMQQATAHSKWMAQARKLTHRGRTTLMGRLKGSGVRFRTGAENIGVFHIYRIDGVMTRPVDISSCRIAYMDGTSVPRHSYASLAKLAVSSFMASPQHRKNLLLRKVDLVGNGSGFDLTAAQCGQIYVTQIFAG